MSIVSPNNENKVAIFDCVQRFFLHTKSVILCQKCNGAKEKKGASCFFLRYKLSSVLPVEACTCNKELVPLNPKVLK